MTTKPVLRSVNDLHRRVETGRPAVPPVAPLTR